jgi:hypothetical protein
MIKQIVSLALATVATATLATSAFAEAPTNTTNQQGQEYQDIRHGRSQAPVEEEVEIFDQERAEEQYLNSESADPGHYNGPESEDPGCPEETDNDDDILRERARQNQNNTGN